MDFHHALQNDLMTSATQQTAPNDFSRTFFRSSFGPLASSPTWHLLKRCLHAASLVLEVQPPSAQDLPYDFISRSTSSFACSSSGVPLPSGRIQAAMLSVSGHSIVNEQESSGYSLDSLRLLTGALLQSPSLTQARVLDFSRTALLAFSNNNQVFLRSYS